MKNKEKYRDEIFAIACSGSAIAVVDGRLVRCNDADCANCEFARIENNIYYSCSDETRAWCEAEYIEPKQKPKLTKLERALIDCIVEDFKIERTFGYLWVVFNCWYTKNEDRIELDPSLFTFLKNKEPMSKKDLLSLEVEQ